jgi:hypothetical protein
MAGTEPYYFSNTSYACTISFSTLIKAYQQLQSTVIAEVRQVASNISTATPGKFLMLQFSMSQVTQIGDSISNLVSQIQSVISLMIRNQKTS